ncbi:hypothetical protein DFS34DRAFT_498146 [Phlyctochytrium arcticum]|nr:hypothetical protein DFS34DRAFT_498146 [Phlyctochytrium arcticum]
MVSWSEMGTVKVKVLRVTASGGCAIHSSRHQLSQNSDAKLLANPKHFHTMSQSSSAPEPSGSSPQSHVDPHAIRKLHVEAKFGKGSYKPEKVQPHRCNPHVDDFCISIQTFPWRDVPETFMAMVACFRSRVGEEPPRIAKEPTPYGVHSGEKKWIFDLNDIDSKPSKD